MSKHITYIKQRDKTSCGPVALINILKWMNLSVTYKFIDIARHFCNWKPGFGITQDGMIKGLNKFKIDFTIIKNPTIMHLDNHLNTGGIFIFDYYLGGMAHYTLCIGHTKYFYNMVNDGIGNTIKKRSKKSVERIIKNTKGTDEESVVYFIIK